MKKSLVNLGGQTQNKYSVPILFVFLRGPHAISTLQVEKRLCKYLSTPYICSDSGYPAGSPDDHQSVVPLVGPRPKTIKSGKK